jgi:hypothetical protein
MIETLQKGFYKHYKGNVYKVIEIAKNTETLETLVIYQDIVSSEKIWARPISMWNDNVVFNGETVKRFELVKEEV